jgi:hypothetical protein
VILIIKFNQQFYTFVVLKIFSQISSIIVALLFVYTINFKSFVTVSYFVNQAEIIELFCVNKDKPVLQCNGKCHLATQLAEVETDAADSPFSESNITYSLEINLDLAQAPLDIQPNLGLIKQEIYISNSANLCDGFHAITSPPPKV